MGSHREAAVCAVPAALPRRRSSVAQRRCDALAFATPDDSQFISDKVAGRVCVFLTPQSVVGTCTNNIHTQTNIRKPFFLSDSLSNFTQSDLN